MKIINLVFCLLCLSAMVNHTVAQKAATIQFNTKNIFKPQGQHVHSSCITELPNGDLLSCWFQGSGERTSNDVKIMGARLKKGDENWSLPFVMADTPGNPDCNPVVFMDGKNRLHLTWVVVVANAWESSILKTRISGDYSGDGAPKWEWQDIILLKPGDEFIKSVEKQFRENEAPDLAWGGYAPQYEKQVTEAAQNAAYRETGWMGRIRPTVLKSGRIILPLYSDGYNFSLMAVSDDDGDTWKPSLPVCGRGNIQPVVFQKKDGSLVAYMRDNGDAPGRVMVSTSTDNGISWSFAKKTDIPNPGASVAGMVLKDGKWVLVYNDLEDGRYRLRVSLSDDEGATWKYSRYIENNREGGFAYPNIIQSKDGLINITYSWSVKNDKTIKHVSFQPEWISENQSVVTNAEKLGFPPGKKILLLHCDDAGMCPEANEAVKAYYSKGVVRSAAVMMPCPSAADMVSWANSNPGADIGVHLTLTSEWKTYRWTSVTNPLLVPGLLDPQGKLWKDVPEVVVSATPQEVEMEIRAQIALMKSLGHTPTHIDTHMGTLYGSPGYVKVFLKVAQEYGIPANAIDLTDKDVFDYYKAAGYPLTEEVVDLIRNYKLPKLDNFTSAPNAKTYPEKKEAFMKLVTSLKPGLTEIIFHPSVESDNLKSITGSWQQRVWEAQLFSDPDILNFFRDNNIQITTWKEIMEKFNGAKK